MISGLGFRYAQGQAKSTPLKATLHNCDYRPSVESRGDSIRQQKPVRFYHSFDPYFEFTNFYPRQVRIFGKDWPTTEHFFQAQKFCGTPIEEKIRKCKTAREAFETARRPDYIPWIRRDWHSADVKDQVMLLAVHSKFSQHEDLMNKLFETGHRDIIEHTSNDSYWGDGGDGSGMNKLGGILERVRGELDPDGSKRKRPRSARKERSSSVDRTPRACERDIGSYPVPPHRLPRSRSSERRSLNYHHKQEIGSDSRYCSQSVNGNTMAKLSYADVTKKRSNYSQTASNAHMSPKPSQPKRSDGSVSGSSIGITAKPRDQTRATTPHRHNDSSQVEEIFKPAHAQYQRNTRLGGYRY